MKLVGSLFESSIPIHRKFDHLQRLLASFDVDHSRPGQRSGCRSGPGGKSECRRSAARSWSIRRRPIRNLRSARCVQALVSTSFYRLSKALWPRPWIGPSTTLREKALPGEKTEGKLLVFTGSKGGSGVTTVACNVADRSGPVIRPERPADRPRSSHWRRGTVPGDFRGLLDGGRPARISTGWMRVFFRTSVWQASVRSLRAGGSHQSSRG